jgi:quercetin dioxygenase-like cupin family protein
MNEANAAPDDQRPRACVRRFADGDDFRWDDIDLLVYKPVGSHFKDITRQVLFGREHGLTSEWRYFEIADGGHSTLERHNHVHAVLIIRGSGTVLLGDRIEPVRTLDAVYVPPQTWHQFVASEGMPLGFLCLVACDRDRPARPTPDEAAALLDNPDIRDHIRL